MTAETTVAEIIASGGTALGLEVDATDHAAVDAMVARVMAEWGRVDVLVANAGGGRGRPMDTKASNLDPALLQLVVGHEPLWDRLQRQRGRPGDEGTAVGEDHHGQLGGRARRRRLMAATPIMARRKRQSRITRDIWPRIWGPSGSPRTASRRG